MGSAMTNSSKRGECHPKDRAKGGPHSSSRMIKIRIFVPVTKKLEC